MQKKFEKNICESKKNLQQSTNLDAQKILIQFFEELD